MVREHQVHTATVDVELMAKILLTHHGALEMPARETLSPRRRPPHNMLRLSLFPKRKVVWSTLVGLAVKSPGTLLGVIQCPSRKHAVMMVGIVLRNIEIN